MQVISANFIILYEQIGTKVLTIDFDERQDESKNVLGGAEVSCNLSQE